MINIRFYDKQVCNNNKKLKDESLQPKHVNRSKNWQMLAEWRILAEYRQDLAYHK